MFRLISRDTARAVASVLAISLVIERPATARADDELPTITVTADNTRINRSCRIVIPPETIIEDADDNGVIQIVASSIEVEFAPNSVLRGAPSGRSPDTYAGCGIRVNDEGLVTIRRANVHGYKCNIRATHADGLTVEDCDFSEARADRLKSTPVAEDASDWLRPQRNDSNEWVEKYGAGLCVERSRRATIRRCRCLNSQNGLILDRVNESKVHENDFSFLSGWGIAMWRSDQNVICRNALDFCIRGYSHGIYNRGQDSAGLLLFEQCHKNTIAENSATHCGDGFFGFAGREALGEAAPPAPGIDYRRLGSNDNLLIHNDFSDAAAHGVEITFSFGNMILQNRIVGNGICGIWCGYSLDTQIVGNLIEENGEAGAGLERGGVNIEHGRGNSISQNDFRGNACAIHLWWDEDAVLAKLPWVQANGAESTRNLILGNTIVGDPVAFQFRGPGDVTIGQNELQDVGRELIADDAHHVKRDESLQLKPLVLPGYQVFGTARPVGARAALAGRRNIIMTEWGPWDHASPLIRMRSDRGFSRQFDLFNVSAAPRISLHADGLAGALRSLVEGATRPTGSAPTTQLTESPRDPRAPIQSGLPRSKYRYTLKAEKPGVYPYALTATSGDWRQEITGTLVAARWHVIFFASRADPLKDLAAWRESANAPDAATATLDILKLPFGAGGPAALRLSESVSRSGIGPDHFGLIAKTALPLPAGKWRFVATSDDGVRVTVDGRPVIENWSWHVPTRDAGEIEFEKPATHEIVVEYFEIDGHAVLDLSIELANRSEPPATSAPAESDAEQIGHR